MNGFEQMFGGPGWSAVVSEAKYKAEQYYGIRCLTRIKICRIPLFTGGVPGHYWVQILHADKSIESYGWYPAEATGFRSMLGYSGCINGDSKKRRDADEKTLKDKPDTPRVDLKAGRGIGHQPHPYDPHHDDVATKHKHHPYLFKEDGRSEE